MELNLPTGIPIVYELDKNLKPIGPMQFLGDEETVKKAMEAVAAQGKAKKQTCPSFGSKDQSSAFFFFFFPHPVLKGSFTVYVIADLSTGRHTMCTLS